MHGELLHGAVTGARKTCNRDFSEAFTTSWASPAALASAVARSPSRMRRYSSTACCRVSITAASAASASCRWLCCTPSSFCCSTSWLKFSR